MQNTATAPVLNRQQRRALGSIQRRQARAKTTVLAAPVINEPDFDLIKTAYEIAAETYGTLKLSPGHAAALMYIAGRLTHLANGRAHAEFRSDTVRLAYGLKWGGGKTLSAKAWIAAVHRLGKPYSVTVAANEIEALCEIKRSLVDDFGVPADMIGLYHSYGYNPKKLGKPGYASEPSTPVEELADKQFLLVTHNLVRTGQKNLDKFNVYQGRPRDLVVYDESLLVSDARTIKTRYAKAGSDNLAREIKYGKDRDDLHVVKQYIDDCLAVLEQDGEDATLDKHGAIIDRLPDLSDYGPDLAPHSLALRLPNDCPKSVNTLLNATGQEVRVMRAGAGPGAAWFTLKVPDELKSVMVLDASHVIRELGRLGTNITTDPKAPKPDISYSDMTIEYFQHRAGREYITEECQKPVAERRLAKIVADWIKALPETETTLVWTFKQRDRRSADIRALLEQALRHHGVDMERVRILTHGKGRGSNSYGDAHNVAHYGVLEPDRIMTGAQMLGQHRSLTAGLQNLEAVHFGEILHEATQEIARSNIRHIDRGKAGRGRVLFPCSHVEGVSEKLGDDTIFMHAKLIRRTDLEPKVPTGKVAETKAMAVAKSVILALSDLDEDVASISSRRLRPMVESRVDFKITKRVWKDAVNLAAKWDVPPYRETAQPPTSHFHDSRNDPPVDTLAGAGWRRTSQGFQRFTAADYGLG